MNKNGNKHIEPDFDFGLSKDMEDKVKELLSEDDIPLVRSIIYHARLLAANHAKKGSRADTKKSLVEIHRLTRELFDVVEKTNPTAATLIFEKLSDIDYPGAHELPKLELSGPSGSCQETVDLQGFFERLLDDLEWLNEASAIDFNPRGSWPKQHINYLVIELYATWRDCHGCRPKRSYDPVTGKEGGKFRELALAALNEIEPGAKAPDGIIRRLLETAWDRNT